jgi:hypothetical protein
MYGGLLKTASAAAILAAAGFFGAGTAKAADLGGDCCADLEERVAELEATTVRKGNRKVSVTLSGYVSHHVMYWDDGHRSDTYIGDGGNYGSRFRFLGSAKISPTLTAGFLYEWQSNSNQIGAMDQTNGGDDGGATGSVAISGTNSNSGCGRDSGAGCTTLRDSTVWLRHSQLGMVKVGHGSTATDNLVLIDLGGMSGASTPDVALYMGKFRLSNTAGTLATTGGLTWDFYINGGTSFDTARRNHVLYETPTLAGFTVQAAVGEDNFWDVALRYAGEFGGFRLAFGIGYQEDTEFNGAAGDVICTTNCNQKNTEFKGSASVLHVPTGLFLTGAAGQRSIDNKTTAPASPTDDATFWYLAGGISQNWFGFGKTVLFGEYSEHKDFAQQSVAAFAGGFPTDVTHWGLGVVQYVDAAAMEVFLTYKHYELDGVQLGGLPIEDFQTVIGGARISF